jgi:hypothetical protein
MAKGKRSFCDEYRKQMVGVLGELGKEEAQLDASRKSSGPSSAAISRQASLARKIALHRKALAFLFFEYLLEDEYD